MSTKDSWLRQLLTALVAVLAIGLAPRTEAATHLLEGYVGVGVGHANLRASDAHLIGTVPNSELGSFDVGHSAYQLTAGVRALEFLGAELDYFDLGNPGATPVWSGPGGLTDAHIGQHGTAAFGVLYLPLPFVDFYVKAGVAHLATHLDAAVSSANCPAGQPCPQIVCAVGTCQVFTAGGSRQSTTTTFAAGAGVQLKLGAFTLRGEYERFGAFGQHPDLLDVGLTYAFW